MTLHMLLNALLILIGPFLIVAPLALAAAAQFSPRSRRPFVAWRLPSIRLVVVV